MLNFSCADFTFPVVDRATSLRLIRLLGLRHVDIGLFARSSHFSPFDLQASKRSYITQSRNDLQSAELAVSDVFLQIGGDPSECAANNPSPIQREKNREIFARALEFCVAVGSRHLTGLPGVFHPESTFDRDMGLAEEEAATRMEECANVGVIYSIEPHVGSICADVASASAFVNAVEGLTLTLDYGHFVMAGESSEHVHSLLGFASHIHVRGGAFGRLQTSVKENAIDFPGMLAGLYRLHYRGFLALEYVWIDWNDCNRTDNISETLLLRDALNAASRGLADDDCNTSAFGLPCSASNTWRQ
jgi:sugar phosphate isomerase/epimerase